MEDDDQVERLLATLDSAVTADKRIAALQSLQAYINEADEIPHVDQLTASLKTQLKNQNHQVSCLALTILPAYVVKLASNPQPSRATQDVKTVLLAILAIVLERLGDHKEKIREGARSTIVEMAKAAFAVSPVGSTLAKDSHTAVAIFERGFKEGGLSSKLAKVKEQATLALIPLRKAIDKFPLRPFLPSLVEQLSDADPIVREASRTACINLFSTATSVAKSELKKEMEKKGVRKQTSDAILAEVLGGGTVAGVEELHPIARSHHDEDDRRPPPRSASRMEAADTGVDDGIKPLYVASQWDLERTITAMLPCFEGKETEHNWLEREQSVVKLRGMLKTGAQDSFPEGFLGGLKQLHEGILKATASLRTTLSMHGLQLISELAQKMREGLDSLAEPFVMSIIKMAGYTKKIVASASQAAVHEILIYVSYRHKFLDLIWQGLQDKTVTTRAFMCDHLITILETHGTHRKHAVEGHGGLELIEKFLKKAIPDQNKDVREKARLAFYKVEIIWPAIASGILENLDIAYKKQIESNRGKVTAGSAVPGTPQSKAGPTMRNSITPGPSSAILAAKRAAAARLAQERRLREEAEAAAQMQNEVKAREEEQSSVSKGSTSYRSSHHGDISRRLRQEAENQVEADSSQQLMEESEEGDYVDPTPKKSTSVTFPPLPQPKSPLRSPVGISKNVHEHSRTLTPSSIPLPISPRWSARSIPHQVDGSSHGSSSPPSLRLGASDGRTRTASTSSSSSIRSTGRLGSTGNHNSTSRFESFGQRVGHTSSGLPTPTRVRTTSNSSSSMSHKINATTSPSLRGGPISTTSLLHNVRPIENNQEADDTVQLDPFPDASMNLMSSSTSLGLVGDVTENPSSMGASTDHMNGKAVSSPPKLPTTPSSSSFASRSIASPSTERSRLPRPVSVIYQGTSPLTITPKHTHSRSIDDTQKTKSATSPVETDPTKLNPPAPSVDLQKKGENKAADRVQPSSSSIKWFLGKASRLDHVDRNRSEQVDNDLDVQLSPVKKRPESEVWISQLQSGQADVRTFKCLASICKEFKLPEGTKSEDIEGNDDDEVMLKPGRLPSRSALGLMEVDQTIREEQIAITMWLQGNLFERLFSGLYTYLCAEPSPSKDLKTAAMIVLHRLVENQFKLFGVLGKERELLQLIFDLIKSNKISNVKSACQAIMESWSNQTNIIMGISTLRGVLSSYLTDTAQTSSSTRTNGHSKVDTSNASLIAIHTLSLRSLFRLFQKLPIELVEEEVQRCKVILKEGLNHWNIETRQQAVAVLVAANSKVNDPKSLFSILQPMDRAQEDLLMYYMSIPS